MSDLEESIVKEIRPSANVFLTAYFFLSTHQPNTDTSHTYELQTAPSPVNMSTHSKPLLLLPEEKLFILI